jgi:sucrose-6-phosphate hydrolase SacC (GH32 family)
MILSFLLLFTLVCSQTNYMAGCTQATAVVYVSTDGRNWTASGAQPNDGSLFGAAFSPLSGRWIVTGLKNVGGETTFYSDDDGASWNSISPQTALFSGQGVTFSEVGLGLWVLSGTPSSGSAPRIFYSTYGQVWTPSSVQPFWMGFVKATAFSLSQNRWVAVGGEASAGTSVAVSSDADVWVRVGQAQMFGPVGSVGASVTFSVVNNMWIAVGSSSTATPSQTLLSSVDGSTWNALTAGTFFSASGLVSLGFCGFFD